MLRRVVLLMVPIVLLLAGCQNVVPGKATPPVTHLSGPQDVVVRVITGGGYVPTWVLYRTIPTFVLAGDGTAMVPKEFDGNYQSQPSIWPFHTSTFDADRIQKVIALADHAGLIGATHDYGFPGVTDMPDTSVQITVNGETTKQSVYALSYTDGDDQLTSEQRELRKALREFITAASDMVSADAADYQPTAVVVHRLESDGVPAQGTPRPWPIATAPGPITGSEYQSCVVVAGDEAAKLLEAAEDAIISTAWTVDGADPVVFVLRPMLPGDPGCAD